MLFPYVATLPLTVTASFFHLLIAIHGFMASIVGSSWRSQISDGGPNRVHAMLASAGLKLHVCTTFSTTVVQPPLTKNVDQEILGLSNA